MLSFVSQLVVVCLVLSGDMVFASNSTARISENSIITIAGNGTASSTGTGGVATAMTVYSPQGVWVSSLGVVYVAEKDGYCVRKFSYPNGIVFSVAGVPGSPGSTGDNGPATSAKLNNPFGVVVDTLAVVYITDLSNNKVRGVSASGIITSIAGTGTAGSAGDNGPASSAILNTPAGLWADSLSQLYVTSIIGNTVRRIGSDVNRIITTIAGTGNSGFTGDGGPATSAALLGPKSGFAASIGLIYIADTFSNRIRRVTTGGIISTVIGTGSTSFNGDQPGTSCNLNLPKGVVVDPSNGDIYVASSNNYLVQVLTATSGIVTDSAGNQNSAYSGENVAATSAGVFPSYLFLDTNSRLFITDVNNRVRMTYPTSPSMVPTVAPSFSSIPTVPPTSVRSSQNSIITIAGTGVASSTGTGGVATAMTLNFPMGVWVTSMGTVFIAENGGFCVRKFSYPNGIVFPVAGLSDSHGFSGDNEPATSSLLNYPNGIVVDTLGVVYISDNGNLRIRMVSISGIIKTIAGTGTYTSTGDNWPASSAGLDYPSGLWMDSLYQLYVACYGGNTVRRIGSDVNRIITTIAGTGTGGFSGDGGPATSATLDIPYSVFVDTVGVVYIGDDIARLRRVTTGGIISTVIGSDDSTYIENQPGTSCSLYGPYGVVVDPSNGDIYVSSTGNNIVQVLSGSSGIVTVFAGNQNWAYSGENVAATSAGVRPWYLFLDTNSQLFIGDENNRVRMTFPSIPTSHQPTFMPSVVPSFFPSVIPSLNPNTVPSADSESTQASSAGEGNDALIGIIVGAVVGFTLLVGAVWWWVRRSGKAYYRVHVTTSAAEEKDTTMFVGEMQTRNQDEKFV